MLKWQYYWFNQWKYFNKTENFLPIFSSNHSHILYICIGFLFPYMTSSNNVMLVKSISKTILLIISAVLLIISAVLLLLVRNSVFGFIQIFISTFCFVVTSFSSDTKAFQFKGLTWDMGGNMLQKWAKTYKVVTVIVTNWVLRSI